MYANLHGYAFMHFYDKMVRFGFFT